MNNTSVAFIAVGFVTVLVLIGYMSLYIKYPEEFSEYSDACGDLKHHSKKPTSFVAWCVNYLETNPDTTGQEVLDRHTEWRIQERDKLLTEPVTP